VDEFELIRRYFERQSDAPFVRVGIGDDGAVLQPEPGRELVTVIDTIVAGVHFPAAMHAADVGYRAVAVNLSDLAAMGARPRWMTLALTLAHTDTEWLDGFATGLREAASEWDVELVGGDTTRGDNIVISVQMTGDVDAGNAILRSGATVGDSIFVTGTIGDAAAGLGRIGENPAADYLARRFARPRARVATGLRLAGRAHAAIDLSDGLVADLAKLIEASGVGAEIDVDRLPLSDELRQAAGPREARRFAMGGGDDYEICFTMPEAALPDELPDPVTAIGRITGLGELVCLDEGVVVPFDSSGYRHFR
jgi:thiamine-monophosphate kinase